MMRESSTANAEDKALKVTVSVYGRFHAFYLAQQLHKRGSLHRLITSYPKSEVEKYGIPRSHTQSILLSEIARRGWRELPNRLTGKVDPRYWLNSRFDIAAARRQPDDADIFVGWSGFSERQLHKAKESGQVTILERGSSHIEYQRDILREEYDRFGMSVRLPHAQVVEQEKREYELADYIEVPSSFAYQSFVDKGIRPEKLIKGFRGVDLNQFHQSPKSDDVFRVIYVGQMSLRKGVQYLLEAFAKLQLPNAELWLIGSKFPEIEPTFEKYQGNFRYFGRLPQATLHQYYSQCSVFAIMSLEEGLAMVQPQAMACGLPLICTTNTGGGDLITDGQEGFIIPIRDVDALCNKLAYLYDNHGDCLEMGQLAKRCAQQRLTWDAYGTQILQQYRNRLTRTRDRESVCAVHEPSTSYLTGLN